MVMKQINEYINENLETNLIKEGAIWKAIKNWFKKLFSSDDNDYFFKPSKKKYDRFKDDGKYINSHNQEYTKYIKSNFEFKYISVGKKRAKLIQDIINNHQEFNFKINEDHTYFIGAFFDNNVKDVVFIIDGYQDENDTVYEIYNIYIIEDYKQNIKIKDIIDILLNKKEEIRFSAESIQKLQKLYILEKNNKELYKQLIKECNFKENGKLKMAILEKESQPQKEKSKEKIINKNIKIKDEESN